MKKTQNWTTIGVLMLIMAGAVAYIGWVAPTPSLADASWPEPGLPGQPPKTPGFEVNQIVTELRVDQPEVSQTRHWSQKLESFDTGPTGEGQNFTSAWFSLNIGSCPKDPECGFTKAGLLNNKEGMHWFVYSNLPITCDFGREMWNGRGCVGKLHELFGEDFPGLTPSAVIHFFRTRQAQWVIQIQPPPGLKDPDPPRFSVAFVESTGKEEVTRATSTFEAAFKDTGKHPKTEGHYIHSRPQYLKKGEMVEWSASDKTHRNQVFVFSTDGPFCPQIYSLEGYFSEFEHWLTGSTGGGAGGGGAGGGGAGGGAGGGGAGAGVCHVDRLF